jgi:hypothetical protein
LSPAQDQEAIMAEHWPASTDRVDVVSATAEEDASYLAGWTISGVATLATIVVVWVFAI